MVKANPPVPREPAKIASLRDAMALAVQKGLEIEDDPDPYGYGAELEATYGINLVSPSWESHPDDDRWVERHKSRGRMAIVAMLSLQGYSELQIANRVGASEISVRKDLGFIAREWKSRYLELAEDLAIKDLARLDYYLSRLTPGIVAGDVPSIRAAVDIVKQRAEIMGYKQGMQFDAEFVVRQAAESQGLDPERAVEIAAKVSMHMK